jgi:N6-adenosine-specific RNA methylase IME4
MLEKLVPEGPRADIFARRRREGWSCFGNELEKFEAEAAE